MKKLIFTALLFASVTVTAQAQDNRADHINRLESIILIEDMIEWTEWDISEGKTAKETGLLLIMNLEVLKARLEKEEV